MAGIVKLLGLDKVAKLGQIIKNHGGIKASLYHLYRTDDLKVCLFFFLLCFQVLNFLRLER